MATRVETVNECDMCGEVTVMRGRYEELPHGWARCELIYHILGNNNKHIKLELCPSCAKKIETAMTCK